MTKIPEQYFIVSDVDCATTDTFQKAKKTALEHFDENAEIEDVKIYKLVDIAERKVIFANDR